MSNHLLYMAIAFWVGMALAWLVVSKPEIIFGKSNKKNVYKIEEL